MDLAAHAGARCALRDKEPSTVIPGIMLTGINSDLPGKLIAQVSQHVYDTATGNMLVIHREGNGLFRGLPFARGRGAGAS